MKKIISLACLLLSCVAHASVVCPPKISCDFDAGTCENVSGWSINASGGSSFTQANLKEVSAMKQRTASNYSNEYTLICHYEAGPTSSFSLERKVQTLIGNKWQTFGFGKHDARCSDTDLSACAGE